MIGKTNAIAQTGIDTSDATAVIDDISLGKTAYVNGEKLTGTNRYKDEFLEFIENRSTHLSVPYGATTIGEYKFYRAPFKTVSLPDTLIVMGGNCFHSSSLEEVSIPVSMYNIGFAVFYNTPLKVVNLPEGILTIDSNCFYGTKLTEVILPSTMTRIAGGAFFYITTLKKIVIRGTETEFAGSNTFTGCTKIEEVYLPNDFNGKSLNLSTSTLYTTEMIVSWLGALADRTGKTTYTLTIGATNLAKLTEEQVAIATDKNWTLA